MYLYNVSEDKWYRCKPFVPGHVMEAFQVDAKKAKVHGNYLYFIDFVSGTIWRLDKSKIETVEEV